VIGAVAIGLAGGVVAGLLGVGGGVLFVPGLVIFLGLEQHQAEATSLLAIIPVALVGTYRQDRYGHVRRADALMLGLLSVAGAGAGVVLANALSGTVLRDAFAVLILVIAAQLVHRTLHQTEAGTAAGADQPRGAAIDEEGAGGTGQTGTAGTGQTGTAGTGQTGTAGTGQTGTAGDGTSVGNGARGRPGGTSKKR
jgi:uncharacterized protein